MLSSPFLILCLGFCGSVLGGSLLRAKRQFHLNKAAPCLKVSGFYRDPQRVRDTPSRLRGTCRDFYKCVSGTVYPLRCPPQTTFDVVLQGCANPDAVTDENCALDTKGDFHSATTPRPSFNSTSCRASEYQCGGGQCIPKELFCNNVPNCADNSDELFCGLDEDPLKADPCDEKACMLPDCFCSAKGTAVPDDLTLDKVPQMVLLMFDDAFNDNNMPIFNATFLTGNRTNPGGCGIKATFFVTHVYNNYQYLEKLAKSGHEIALKGVDTDRSEAYWTRANESKLLRDFVTERRIISKFGRVPESSMSGMRMPFLKGAGNAQFSFMAHNGIKWDSSISIEPLAVPIWPFTLNYRMPTRCYPPEKTQCPARSFPGLWEIPLNTLAGVYDETCSVLSSCSRADTADDMIAMLERNLQKHYTTNRAPLSLSMSTNWFTPENSLGLQQWIDSTLATKKDVYFVTASQAIAWIQNPTPIAQLGTFAPWQCPAGDPVPVCDQPHGCNLDGATAEMRGNFMITCMPCPSFFPDFGIPDGEVLDA